MTPNTTLSYEPPSGPHHVGVCDGEIIDTMYPTIRLEDANGRRLMVRVWYPAASADGRRRMYFEGAELEVLGIGFSEVSSGMIPAEWLRRLGEMETYSRMGVDVAVGAWPTLVFSHGGGGYVSQNTPLMEHLASHGYIVWSVAHPGESAGILYPDGTVARYDESFKTAVFGLAAEPSYMIKITGEIPQRLEAQRDIVDDKALGPWAARWRDDMVAVIDALEDGTVIGDASTIVPSCDLGRIGLFGMSFGAAAAVSAAQKDSRVKAAVNLDGGQFLSDVLDTDVRVPLLVLNSNIRPQMEARGLEVNCIYYNEFFFEPLRTIGLRADIKRLLIPDATHIELTDIAFFPSAERAATIPLGGKMDGRRLVDIMNAFIGAYFDHVLKDADNGYPERQLQEFLEVVPIDVSAIREWATTVPAAPGS